MVAIGVDLTTTTVTLATIGGNVATFGWVEVRNFPALSGTLNGYETAVRNGQGEAFQAKMFVDSASFGIVPIGDSTSQLRSSISNDHPAPVTDTTWVLILASSQVLQHVSLQKYRLDPCIMHGTQYIHDRATLGGFIFHKYCLMRGVF